MEEENRKRLQRELSTRQVSTVVLESAFLVAIQLTALAGNTLVCWVIYKKPRLRTVTNVYVVGLALSDVFMAVLIMSWSSGILMTGQWVFGVGLCRFQGSLIVVSAWASLHTMTLTALNRYFRVVRPNLYRKWFTIKTSIVMVLSVWVCASLLVASPVIAGWTYFTFRPGKTTCFMTFHAEYETFRRVYTYIMVLLYTIIPMITIALCYFKVFRVAKRHTNSIRPALQARHLSNQTMSVREIKITRTLFAMVVGFGLCWIPVTIIEFLNTLQGTGSLPRGAYLGYIYLVYLSNAINPIIYGVINKSFRRELARVLPCAQQITFGPVTETRTQIAMRE